MDPSQRDVCSAHVVGEGKGFQDKHCTAISRLGADQHGSLYQCLSGFRDHKVKDQTGGHCNLKYRDQQHLTVRRVFKWTCTHYLQ